MTNRPDSHSVGTSVAGISSVSPTVVTVGFTIVDHVYVDGELRFKRAGGTSGNVARALAYLGHRVAPVADVGQDDQGAVLVDSFELAGCDTSLVRRLPDVSTPWLEQLVETKGGEATHRFRFPGGRGRLQEVAVDRDRLLALAGTASGAHVVFADRISPAILDFLVAAKSGGAMVYLEPNDDYPDLGLVARTVEVADVVKFSSDAFDDDDMLDVVLRATRRDAALVTTRGACGLTLLLDREESVLPANPIQGVVDACGAGDMTTTGLIDRIVRAGVGPLSREVLAEGLAAGQRFAAANCGHLGALGLIEDLGAAAARACLDNPQATWSGVARL